MDTIRRMGQIAYIIGAVFIMLGVTVRMISRNPNTKRLAEIAIWGGMNIAIFGIALYVFILDFST